MEQPVSEILGDLYFKQGYFIEAKEIYKKLISKGTTKDSIGFKIFLIDTIQRLSESGGFMKKNIKEILKEGLGKVEECVAFGVMDMEGIPVEVVKHEKSSTTQHELEVIFTEAAHLVKKLKSDRALGELVKVKELSLQSKSFKIILNISDEGFIVFMILGPDAVETKARFYINYYMPDINNFISIF